MKFVKLKNFLVYSLLFLLPWQTRLILRTGELAGGYWEYGTISLYVTEIILGLALFVFAFLLIKEKRFQIFRQRRILPWRTNFPPKTNSPLADRFQIWLFVICYLLVVSFFALRKDLHFYYLLRFAEGFALYFLVRSVELKKASWAFIFGMIPQAVLGIWQFLAQSSFASKWFGMAAHDPSALGTFVIETASGRWLRAYGGLPHPNILGGYLALALMLIIFNHLRPQPVIASGAKQSLQIAASSRPAFCEKWGGAPRNDEDRNRITQSKKLSIVNSYLLLVIFSSALFFTFSRSAWLTLLAVLTVILLRSQLYKLRAVGALLFFITFIILSLIYRDLLFTRFSGDLRLEVKSQVERVSGAREALQIFKKHSLIGVGLGNYTYAVWKEIDANRPSFAYQPVHSIFLLLFAELGIVGALLVVALLYMYRRSFILPALVFLAVLGLFDHYLLTLYSGILLLPASAALATEIQAKSV